MILMCVFIHLHVIYVFQAALNYVVDENLQMILSCTYLQKYVKENPEKEYLTRIKEL